MRGRGRGRHRLRWQGTGCGRRVDFGSGPWFGGGWSGIVLADTGRWHCQRGVRWAGACGHWGGGGGCGVCGRAVLGVELFVLELALFGLRIFNWVKCDFSPTLFSYFSPTLFSHTLFSYFSPTLFSHTLFSTLFSPGQRWRVGGAHPSVFLVWVGASWPYTS